MKLFFTVLAIFATFSPHFSKKSLGKHREFPRSLSSLKQMVFPKPEIPQNLSEIEENPSEFSLLSPFSGKNSRIFATKLNNRDPKPYSLNAANLSDIHEGQVYLPGFQSPLDLELKALSKEKRALYHKDHSAYYNPVGTVRNIYKHRREGLYSVPIQLFANGTRVFEEMKASKQLKTRLKRDKNAYYDPMYTPFLEDRDPLNETLKKAARREFLEDKPVPYDEFLKRNERESEDIGVLLGKKQEFPRTFGRDEALEEALKREATRRERKHVEEEVKTSERHKKEAYYG